jgi:HAD superfamily hydrolase (TIGR01509 family)
VIEAVVFDMDGVLIDSEQLWDDVRREFTLASGGRWGPSVQQDMMGMSSPEWSRYVRDELGVPMEPEAINAEVVRLMGERYRTHLPLLPGAVEAVERMAAHWPLGLASSSNRPIIDLVLDAAGLTSRFQVTVSSEEVARGKPAPDVYLEAVRLLGREPRRCAAIEDSSNGLRAASAAGLRVVAVPNPAFPPAPDALAAADVVLPSLADLTVAAVEG